MIWGTKNKHAAGRVIAALAVFAGGVGSFGMSAAQAQENGYGRDLDGDGNPATDALGFYRLFPIGEAELDPPFQLITFEPPLGRHNQPISGIKKEGFGQISFSDGLVVQVCEGQRYFQYDTKCTYLAPPSGKYAAVYHDDYRRALQIDFDRPVCAASLAVMPTGGHEGENFSIFLDFYKNKAIAYQRTKKDASGNVVMQDGKAVTETIEVIEAKRVDRKRADFSWTNNTFRWRTGAAGFLEGSANADRIDVTVRSRSRPNRNVDFLIDDLAFIPDEGFTPGAACAAELAKIREQIGIAAPLEEGLSQPLTEEEAPAPLGAGIRP